MVVLFLFLTIKQITDFFFFFFGNHDLVVVRSELIVIPTVTMVTGVLLLSPLILLRLTVSPKGSFAVIQK